MRIGIVPNLNPASGGVYQYSTTMLEALLEAPPDNDAMVILVESDGHPLVARARSQNWDILELPTVGAQPLMRRLAQRMIPQSVQGPLSTLVERINNYRIRDADRVKLRPALREWFRKQQLDLVIYPTSRTLSFEAGTPFMVSIHDLQHRVQPEFEEVSGGGRWEAREYLYRNIVRHATVILAESEVGKEDILNFYGPYGADAERILVLPYLPPANLYSEVGSEERHRIRRAYNLPEKYLLYPAQFWPHKNHKRIAEALHRAATTLGETPNLVLSGSHSGWLREKTYREFQRTVKQLKLAPNIQYLGYVPETDMPGLYAEAVALVMPTFFGPTNIPFLEAWARSCPVITSDIRGIREQVGEAAVLVDPRDSDDIARGIARLWNNPVEQERLAGQGTERLRRYGPADFQKLLHQALTKAKVSLRGHN